MVWKKGEKMKKKKVKEIIELIECALWLAKSETIPDAVHKKGLEGTLKDILKRLKKGIK